MRKSVWAGVFLVLLGLAAPALAQRTTGTIIGTVTDESNAVLPGVTVTLKGSAVPGSPTTITSETGVYRFPGLPPGDYTLTYTLQGFTNVTRENVPISVGQEREINAQLKLSSLAENVTVVGESPVINIASTEISTNFTRQWVENAPQRRFTFFDLINQAAGVSAATQTSSRSQSFGSSTNENSYQLDGTDFTAPLTGAAWPWPNTDAIEEVEVLSLGAAAEYGNVQGAVFNVVTRQGGNQFHGDGNIYYQNQSLTGRNTTDAVDSGQPYHRARYRDTTWQLGGPVKRDKFWFFGSFQFQQDYESQPGTPAEFPAQSQAKRMFFKLNYQLTTQQKLQFAYHDDFYRIPGRATALTAPSTIGVEHGHNPSPNFTYTAVLSNKTFVEARYSGFYGKDHGDPLQPGQPRVQPRFKDLDTGRITGGVYSWYDGDSWKTGFNGKLSHYADSFLGGSHDVKLGVQYGEGGSNYVTGYNDYIYTYGTTPAYGYTQLPFHHGGEMRTMGVFADDTYRLGRVTLNLGLRYDHSRALFTDQPAVDRTGAPTSRIIPGNSNLFTWNKVSPRVGLTFKLDEAGRTVFKAHYGRYYRGIVTGEFDNASPSTTARFLFDGVYDSAGNPVNPSKISDNTNLRIDSGFNNPYTDQFIVGFERELMANVGLNVSYIHKNSTDFGAWPDIAGVYAPVSVVDNIGVQPSGQTLQLFKLTSDPGTRLFELRTDSRMSSRYNGFSAQATKRLAHHWQATLDLTLSKSEGRLGSSLGSLTATQSSSAGGSTSIVGLPGFGANPNDFVNTEGRLLGDRPVIGKAQIVYNAPWGLMFGANYSYQTGRLWVRQARVPGLGVRPTIDLEPINGDRRVSPWNFLDLRLQKDFKFAANGANAAVFGDVLNLTNSAAYESVGSRLATTTSFGQPTRFVAPRRLMLGAKIRF
jgi:Carboxypeptidase regulatory-like domain